MSLNPRRVLVFGATGQQGGSAASALLEEGWRVRAFVRCPESPKAKALQAHHVELARGRFSDRDSIRAAMRDVHGVFSVQPSSGGGPAAGVTDEEEERFGIDIADLAVECGVRHLVYTSTNAVGDTPTGLGHLDTKARIEAHIRTLPIAATILRPATFMEMLVMPGFGLESGQFNFFLRPERHMQLVAVKDIGRFAAIAFAQPERFEGKTFEIAGDSVSGVEIARLLTEAAGRPIAYARFANDVLASNPFLERLTELLDEGRLAGNADLAALRAINPRLESLHGWLAAEGKAGLAAALAPAVA